MAMKDPSDEELFAFLDQYFRAEVGGALDDRLSSGGIDGTVASPVDLLPELPVPESAR